MPWAPVNHEPIVAGILCFSVPGGELFERIVVEEYLMEDDAVDYVKQLLEALQFMHEKNIVHLDLKVGRTTFEGKSALEKRNGQEIGVVSKGSKEKYIYIYTYLTIFIDDSQEITFVFAQISATSLNFEQKYL